MRLPSHVGGDRTHEVGFFQASPERLAEHRRGGRRLAWTLTRPAWHSLDDMTADLTDRSEGPRWAWVPAGNDWSVMFGNGVNGTTVDGWHECTATDLGILGIRAVCSNPGEHAHPARMLEVCRPSRTDPESVRCRSIAAHSVDGRWSFETTGEPFDFEDLDAYTRRRAPDRFTSEMLYAYLAALGVPYDQEPEWAGAVILTAHPTSWLLTGRRRRPSSGRGA